MKVDHSPVLPESRQVLQSYRVFLEQARYRHVAERVKAAETCWRLLCPQTKPLEPGAFAAHRQRVSGHQAECLMAFGRYLAYTGWLVEGHVDLLERRIAVLPEPTAGQLRDYMRELRRRNLAPGTIARRVWVVVRWLRRCDPKVQADVRRIDRECVEMMIERAQDAGHTPGTINTQLSDLDQFFSFLSREGPLAGSPILRRHRLAEPDALPRAMAPGEVARFLAVIEGVQDRAIFLIMLRTGIRGGELVSLGVGDMDLARRTLHIRHGNAKMAKSRVVYFSDDAATALRAWLQERREVPTERLFFCWPKLTLTRGTLNWRFQRYCRLAGIGPHYTAHSLRHTFATELLNAGVSLVSVQELLGHERITTTQIYARLSGAVKQAEYIAAMAQIQRRHRLVTASADGEVSDVPSS